MGHVVTIVPRAAADPARFVVQSTRWNGEAPKWPRTLPVTAFRFFHGR